MQRKSSEINNRQQNDCQNTPRVSVAEHACTGKYLEYHSTSSLNNHIVRPGKFQSRAGQEAGVGSQPCAVGTGPMCIEGCAGAPQVFGPEKLISRLCLVPYH